MPRAGATCRVRRRAKEHALRGRPAGWQTGSSAVSSVYGLGGKRGRLDGGF